MRLKFSTSRMPDVLSGPFDACDTVLIAGTVDPPNGHMVLILIQHQHQLIDFEFLQQLTYLLPTCSSLQEVRPETSLRAKTGLSSSACIPVCLPHGSLLRLSLRLCLYLSNPNLLLPAGAPHGFPEPGSGPSLCWGGGCRCHHPPAGCDGATRGCTAKGHCPVHRRAGQAVQRSHLGETL